MVTTVECAHSTYGVLPAATRAAVRRAVLEGVMAPRSAELLRGFDTAGPRDVVASV